MTRCAHYVMCLGNFAQNTGNFSTDSIFQFARDWNSDFRAAKCQDFAVRIRKFSIRRQKNTVEPSGSQICIGNDLGSSSGIVQDVTLRCALPWAGPRMRNVRISREILREISRGISRGISSATASSVGCAIQVGLSRATTRDRG